MSEPYVEYPRGLPGQKATIQQLRTLVGVWYYAHKAVRAGLIAALVSIICAALFLPIESPLSVLAPYPWLIGHMVATADTYLSLRAAGNEFPHMRKRAFLAAAGCFMLPLIGLIIPSLVREWSMKILRKHGGSGKTSKDWAEFLYAQESSQTNPGTTQESE